MKYDYLIVGAGFFGATFARLATDCGKKCLVIDSRNHIAGNAYTKKIDNIDVHEYGPHIFHTNDDDIWEFVNRFTKFNNFVLKPKSFSRGKLYSLPFNMNTFYQMWGCISPRDAKQIIESQKFKGEPKNLEEQALSLVGKDVYELLIKEYTEKQWMKKCTELPTFIIKRLPVRFIYDDNYFNDKYQGIPVNGYTHMFENMLNDIHVELNVNYFDNREYFESVAKKVVFTGKIDEFFDYEYGELEYRCLDFKHEVLENEDNYQGAAVINYPEKKYSHTRIIEHKHFTGNKSKNTVITYENPIEYSRNKTPYYPINDERNQKIFEKYRSESKTIKNVIFGGRLSEYRYYDMHQVIGSSMKIFNDEKK